MLDSRNETLTTAILGLYKRTISSLDAIDTDAAGAADSGGDASEMRIIESKLRELSQQLQELLAMEDEEYPSDSEALLRIIEREISQLVNRIKSLVSSRTTGKSI